MSHNGDSRFDYSAHLLHRRSRRPSSFTDCAPPSCTSLPAFLAASSMLVWKLMKGHIRHHQRTLRSPDHGPGVPHHVVHGYRNGGVVAQADHAKAIAHQNDRKARPVRQPGEGVVVSGDYGYSLSLGLHGPYAPGRHSRHETGLRRCANRLTDAESSLHRSEVSWELRQVSAGETTSSNSAKQAF